MFTSSYISNYRINFDDLHINVMLLGHVTHMDSWLMTLIYDSEGVTQNDSHVTHRWLMSSDLSWLSMTPTRDSVWVD
jgi:hypothetical protein